MNKLIDSPFQDQCDRTCEFKGDVRLPESLNDARIVAQLTAQNVAYCCMLSRLKSLIA